MDFLKVAMGGVLTVESLNIYQSLDQFFTDVAQNDIAIKIELSSWIQHYGLEKYINPGKLHSIRNSKLVSFKFSNAFFVQLNQVSTRNWKH